jgi:hypothetical protein
MSWIRSQGRMFTRSAHRFLFFPVAIAVVTFAATPSAHAADGCTYDPGTLTVSVSVSGLSTGPPDNVLRVDPGGGIQFEGASCGGTVTTTDTILVTGSSGTDRGFFIDLGGGDPSPRVPVPKRTARRRSRFGSTWGRELTTSWSCGERLPRTLSWPVNRASTSTATSMERSSCQELRIEPLLASGGTTRSRPWEGAG